MEKRTQPLVSKEMTHVCLAFVGLISIDGSRLIQVGFCRNAPPLDHGV